MKQQRVFIDRSLDTLHVWMWEQQQRVARLLQASDERLFEIREDGMERLHINAETSITRRA